MEAGTQWKQEPNSFVCRPPCKSFVKGEKDSPDARLGGARTIEAIRTRSSHVCLSAVVSCLRRTGHPFTVSGPCGPSQNARGKLDQFVVGCQCKPLPTCDRQRSRPAN